MGAPSMLLPCLGILPGVSVAFGTLSSAWSRLPRLGLLLLAVAAFLAAGRPAWKESGTACGPPWPRMRCGRLWLVSLEVGLQIGLHLLDSLVAGGPACSSSSVRGNGAGVRWGKVSSSGVRPSSATARDPWQGLQLEA